MSPVTLYEEKTHKNIIDNSLTKGIKWKLKHQVLQSKSPREHSCEVSRSKYFSFQFFVKDLETLPGARMGGDGGGGGEGNGAMWEEKKHF